MPEKRTIERAHRDAREGKAPSTQAGEFVREEIDHVREGKHGVRNSKQAIAIGLSKARKAGIKVPPPPRGSASSKSKSGKKSGRKRSSETSRTRSRATTRALKREGRSGASHAALSRHAKSAARTRRSRRSKPNSSSAKNTSSSRKAA